MPDRAFEEAKRAAVDGFTTTKGNGAEEAKRRLLDTVWADQIAIDVSAPGLVDGLLDLVGLTVLYGPSTVGKTFNVIDLACHVAAGRPWRGHDVRQGIVVYVAAEAPKSVERRVWVWKRYHGVQHLPVLIVRSTVDLLNGDTDAISALLATVRAEHGPVALVAIDTLARAMQGNENAPEDMGRFVGACDRIRSAHQTHVLIVHHTGKDETRGSRGHSSLKCAIDNEWEVVEGTIHVRKARDEVGGTALGFRLEEVELGKNARGRTVTTCVAVAADVQAGETKGRKLGPNERVVFEALTAAIAERAEEPPLAPDIPRTAKGVTVSRWQENAMRYLPQEEPRRKRRAFDRAVTSLVASHAVYHAGGFAWLP